MNTAVTVLWWVLAGTAAAVVTLLAWLLTPARTRAALIAATLPTTGARAKTRAVTAVHGWLTYTAPTRTVTTVTTRPAAATTGPATGPSPVAPPDRPASTPTPASTITEPPADGTNDADPPTPRETSSMPTTTAQGAGHGAPETLDGTVQVLDDAARELETQTAEVQDQIHEIDAQLAVISPRFAQLSKLADLLPHALIGPDCHAALVAVAEAIGADHAKHLLAAKESLVAHLKQMEQTLETVTVAHREFVDYQKEVSEARRTDATAYATTH